MASTRQNWSETPRIQLSREELSRLLQPVARGAKIVEDEIVLGGLSNCMIKVGLADRSEPLLLRIYLRDPLQAQKEVALHKLLRGKVAVPEFFYFEAHNDITGHPYAILQWIEGERLELIADRLVPEAVAPTARSIGGALAGIHSITFSQAGFFDGELAIGTPIELGGNGLYAYVRSTLIDQNGAERLGRELAAQLLNFVETEASLLDLWDGAPSLTHSDFGGSNILMRKCGDSWKVAAVLDWEFAFSGTPFFDLGNLLRKPLGTLPGFEEGVAEGFRRAGKALPEDWRRMSLLCDLTAWVEFTTRKTASEALIADARSVVAATIEQWQSRR